MTTLTPLQIAQYAQAAGFTGNGLLTAVEIALQESGGDTSARNVNTDGSIDRGLLQWNNFYHPEISDSCADDPACAMRAAYQATSGGIDWSAWSLDLTTGRAAAHQAVAQAAIAQLGSGSLTGAVGGTASIPIGTPTDPMQNIKKYLILGGAALALAAALDWIDS